MHWWSKPVHDFNKLIYWCSKLVQGFNKPEHYCTIHQYLNPVHGCSTQVEYNTTVLIINQNIGEAKQCIKYWTANYHMVQQASTRTSTSIGSKMICLRTFRPPKIQPRKVYLFFTSPLVSFLNAGLVSSLTWHTVAEIVFVMSLNLLVAGTFGLCFFPDIFYPTELHQPMS
jgi:hypothetical protein